MRPLVPAFFLKKAAGGKTTASFTACTLFADIPDFTAITNAVMGYGQYAGIIIIWGKPGIGKSRLLHGFLDQLKINADCDLSLLLCQTDDLFQDSLSPFRYRLRHFYEQSDARCRLPHADPLSSPGAN